MICVVIVQLTLHIAVCHNLKYIIVEVSIHINIHIMGIPRILVEEMYRVRFSKHSGFFKLDRLKVRHWTCSST